MSILIKGMEMPKGCAKCPYCDRQWGDPKCHAKSFKGRRMEQKLYLNSRRQDWCPIVEVPKHGRLIDADAFDKTLKDGEANAYERKAYVFEGILNTIRGNLANAPTIIEAEE